VVACIAATLAAATALAQASPFRITHVVERRAPEHVTVTGRVFNEARNDAVEVYVTAEALDGSGRVIASGVSYVGSVPAGASAAFLVKIPAARAAANFRVLVTSFRFGFSVQS
jgi:hypothetical protein